MSFCFIDASTRYAKTGVEGISREQYIAGAIAHLRGVRHTDDEPGAQHYTLLRIDPWMAAMRKVALREDYSPLQDKVTEQWHRLLSSCMTGGLDDFESKLQELGPTSQPSPIQSAACLAAQKGHFDILRYCVNQGAKFESSLNRSAEVGVVEVVDLEYLYKQDWYGVRISNEATMKRVKAFGEDSVRGKWLRENALPPGYKEVTKESLRPPGFRSKDEHRNWTPEQISEWDRDISW